MQTHFHLVCGFNECCLMSYIYFEIAYAYCKKYLVEIIINFLYEIKFKWK